MNEPEYWVLNDDKIRDSALEMRDLSAINYHTNELSKDKRFKNWVYGFRYDALKLSEKIIGKKIFGSVCEIGAGTGIYSCHVAKNEEVKKIYTIDYSKNCVEKLIPFIINRFKLTPQQENKIYPIVGSFNDLHLPNDSLDFVIAMGALHHSEDRESTFKEIYRVLKNSGYLIACERASQNIITNESLNENLDKEYDNEMKQKMGYDVNQSYTRRMNSEHEPLLAEWEYLLTKTGFKNHIFWFHYYKHKTQKWIIRVFWNFFGRIFYSLFGYKLVKKKITQFGHLKIPYYPWFSKSKNPDSFLIISKKVKHFPMP